jgi:type IV secretory pathway VirB10-like protein
MPFDLSTTNILLAGAVVALFVAFIFILMKLQPTTESKQSQEPRTNVDKEKPQPLQAPQPLRTLPPSPKPAESATISKPPVPIAQTSKSQPIGNQVKPSVLTPPRSENRDIPKQNKTAPTPVKPELTPTRKDCIHFYGYLHSLPKNTPIPDECFGCVKIVDCLINPNSSNSSSNSNSNRNSKKRGWL